MMGDVVAYSRLMASDEDDTHARMMQIQHAVIEQAVEVHSGKVVKYVGDGFLAIFSKPEDALAAAIEIQNALVQEAVGFPPERRIIYRIALNVSQIIIDQNDVFGDGVNVTARLQAHAEPGDIVMTTEFTRLAAQALGNIRPVDLGELQLKNIDRPVHAAAIRIGSLRNLTTPAPLRTTDPRPSIAVLPFRRAGTSHSDTIVADAIVEEVVHGLSAAHGLIVISRSSTRRYRGQQPDLAVIAKELNVRYVLTGGVQRQGERLRIVTELTEADTGLMIRHDRFDGEEGELFQLQEQIAVAVMRTIAPEIMEWELRRSMRKRPQHLSAYELVLQALEHLYRLGRDSHAEAGRLLRAAIEIDPEYPPANTYMAYWHIFRVGEGWSDDPAADAREASRVAQKAIERDPRDGLALAMHGHVHSFLLRDFESARAILDRAIDVAPNCAMAWTMSSVTRGYLGDGAAAVAQAETGLRLSPLDGHAFWFEGQLAQAHYIKGDFTAAVAWARRAAAQNPSAMFNLRVLAASLSALGQGEGARRVAQEIVARNPGFALSTYEKFCPFTGQIRRDWLDRLRAAGLPEHPRQAEQGAQLDEEAAS